MSLPTIDQPIYTVTLPSSGEEVRLRPFLVKEEKLLLMALESKDEMDVINTVKQVINNCLIDGNLNLDRLPFYDIDYLFIAMRAKSVGETIELKYRCKHKVDEIVCDTVFPIVIDISSIRMRNKDIPKDIKVTEKITLRMKYPSYAVMKSINDDESDLDKKIKIVMASIDKIFAGDEVFDVNDYKKDDLQNMIESLREEQFRKLEDFVENFPSFYVHVEKECPKCKFKHILRYTDFVDFFR